MNKVRLTDMRLDLLHFFNIIKARHRLWRLSSDSNPDSILVPGVYQTDMSSPSTNVPICSLARANLIGRARRLSLTRVRLAVGEVFVQGDFNFINEL